MRNFSSGVLITSKANVFLKSTTVDGCSIGINVDKDASVDCNSVFFNNNTQAGIRMQISAEKNATILDPSNDELSKINGLQLLNVNFEHQKANNVILCYKRPLTAIEVMINN